MEEHLSEQEDKATETAARSSAEEVQKALNMFSAIDDPIGAL